MKNSRIMHLFITNSATDQRAKKNPAYEMLFVLQHG